MRTPRLYVNQKLTENSVVVLEQQASHYLCKVLRVKAGRELVLFNGCLSDASKTHVITTTLFWGNQWQVETQNYQNRIRMG